MIKGAIFDLDNTLVDFNHLKISSVRSAIDGMIEAGMALNPDEAFDRIMEIYQEKGWEFQSVFDEFILEREKAMNYKFLAAGILGYRKAREAALKPYPHVNATLYQLVKEGIKLAVVSDAPSREAWLRLCQLNFHHLFDVVITFDDSGVRKPAPQPFQMALDRMKLSASETLMIGDWPERDMAGARNLNIPSVFARYGDIFDTHDSGADYEITSFDGILDIIRNLNTGAS